MKPDTDWCPHELSETLTSSQETSSLASSRGVIFEWRLLPFPSRVAGHRMLQFPQLFMEPGTFLICGSYSWWKDADSCCVPFPPLSSGFCDCLVKRVASSWHCKCWKATSWKLKPQNAGNYLGLLFALPQPVTNKYALYPCKCLADNSIPSGWGSFLLPLPFPLCIYVCVSCSLSLPLLAGRSVCAAGRSDQNKNSNTRHRRGNKAKWSIEPECLPSHNCIELFPFFTLPLLFFLFSHHSLRLRG